MEEEIETRQEDMMSAQDKHLKVSDDLVLGGKDLKGELEKMGASPVDHLTASRFVEKFWNNIKNLDVAIQNDMDDMDDHFTRVREITNHSSVKSNRWSPEEDPWYAVYLETRQIQKGMINVISYKAWQIEFLKKIINKLLPVIESIQHASEESIRAKTKREDMDHMMEFLKENQKSTREADARMLETTIKGITDSFAASMQAIQAGHPNNGHANIPQANALHSPARRSANEPEITEDIYMKIKNDAVQKIKELKDDGEEIDIDDIMEGPEWDLLKKQKPNKYENARMLLEKRIQEED